MNSYTFGEVPHQYEGVGSWDEALFMLPSGPDLVPLDAQIISPLLGEAFSVPDVVPGDGYAPGSSQWHGQPREPHRTALQAQALHHQHTQALQQAQLASAYGPGGAGLPMHPLMQQHGGYPAMPGLPYAGEYAAPFGLHAWDPSNRTHAAASANGPAAHGSAQQSPPPARFSHAQKGTNTVPGNLETAASMPTQPHSQHPHTHQQQRGAGPAGQQHAPHFSHAPERLTKAGKCVIQPGRSRLDRLIVADANQHSARGHDNPPVATYKRPLSQDGDGSFDDATARAMKRPRLVWTPELHARFVDAVKQLELRNAVPKTIMQLMNVEGLTRENVASHLQKYRLQLRRDPSKDGEENGGNNSDREGSHGAQSAGEPPGHGEHEDAGSASPHRQSPQDPPRSKHGPPQVSLPHVAQAAQHVARQDRGGPTAPRQDTAWAAKQLLHDRGRQSSGDQDSPGHWGREEVPHHQPRSQGPPPHHHHQHHHQHQQPLHRHHAHEAQDADEGRPEVLGQLHTPFADAPT